MSISPDEYRFVFRERAKDRLREAEEWRLAQAIRRRGNAVSETLVSASSLRRLLKVVAPNAVERTPRRAGSAASEPTR
jgi:hypothetical protein